jgi:hypothetical protein
MNPRNVLEKIVTVTAAWTNLRPGKSFSGRSLEQFKAKMQASHDVRAVIANLEAQLEAAYTRLTTVDRASMDEIRVVVHGVRADNEEGDDGELYSAMGYVRRSQRSSGLTRRRDGEAQKSRTEG